MISTVERKPCLYYSYIPVLPERQPVRRFDVNELKEIRKRLDTGFGGQEEADEIASELLDEAVVVSAAPEFDIGFDVTLTHGSPRSSPPITLVTPSSKSCTKSAAFIFV